MTQTANKMEQSRAKVCAQEKSFTNKALPLFSLFFGKPPKTAGSAQTYPTHLDGSGLSIFVVPQGEKRRSRPANPNQNA